MQSSSDEPSTQYQNPVSCNLQNHASGTAEHPPCWHPRMQKRHLDQRDRNPIGPASSQRHGVDNRGECRQYLGLFSSSQCWIIPFCLLSDDRVIPYSSVSHHPLHAFSPSQGYQSFPRSAHTVNWDATAESDGRVLLAWPSPICQKQRVVGGLVRPWRRCQPRAGTSGTASS